MSMEININLPDITDEEVENIELLAQHMEMLAKRQLALDSHKGWRKPRFGVASWQTQHRFFRVTGYKCSHCKNTVPEKQYYCPACLYQMLPSRPVQAVQPDDDGWEEDMEFFEMMDTMFDD